MATVTADGRASALAEAQSDIEGVVEEIEEAAEGGGRVSVGELLSSLGERGFGPVLLAASAFMLLPVGMLPMVPAGVGLLLVVAGWQLLRGRDGLRLPAFVTKRSLPADPIERSAEKARPWARKAGRLFGHRWARLTRSSAVLHAGGALTMVVGAAMVLLGAIPGLPATLAVPVALYGLGLTANNGFLVLAAFAVFVLAAWAVAWLLPWPPWAFLPGLG